MTKTLMIAGSTTGAHINPAVSISLMTVRKLKPLQCLFYIIGQIGGAFLGAFLVYLVFYSQFNKFDGGIRQITGPNGTGDIFFIIPDKDARDLGPRLFGAFIYGWKNVFHTHNYFFFIPIIGPIVGAILGVWIYTGYAWITKNYGHFFDSEHLSAVKTNGKVTEVNDENSPELREKLAAMDS